MKNIIICLISCLVGSTAFGQNLTIQETINYINNNLVKGGKLSLSEKGIMTYSTYFKDYYSSLSTRRIMNDNKVRIWKPSTLLKTEYNKTTINFYISDLNVIKLRHPSYDDYRPNHYDANLWASHKMSNIYSKREWTVTLICTLDVIYHIESGDCFSVYGGGTRGTNYENSFNICSSNGFKKSAEKIRNALLYLIDLAKQNGYDTKEVDDDPFASNNFNDQKFDIESTQDSDNVKLIHQNGVYHINVKIGGISKKFVLDSGASDVLISKKLEKELIHAGVLKKEDYISSGLYKLADGSIVKCRRLIIKKLEIGDFTVKNVRATVNSSDTMLLGKSVLDKFRNWSIDNLNKTLKLEK